jgi:drug/metabolite transporter (DMT)-like permease
MIESLKKSKVYIMLFASMFFWGMSFIWYKQAYPGFHPISLVLLRLIISFGLLILYSFFLKRQSWPKFKDLKFFLLLAFFEPLMYFLGESFGMQIVSSTLASILIATIPLFSSLAAFYFYKERFTAFKYLGILLSFLGVLFVVYFDGSIGNSSIKGIILMMLAVMSAVGYSLVLKRLLIDYSALIIVTIQNMIGIIYFFPIFLIYEAKGFIMNNYTLHDFMPVIYLAVFASTFSFIFYIEGVKKIGITRAIVFTNFVPIVTAIFAIIILKERMSFIKIAGICLTIAGLLMTQMNAYPKLKILKIIWKR